MSTTTDVRLKARYRSEIAGALTTQFGYKNPMQVRILPQHQGIWFHNPYFLIITSH